jgi:hypothetical protein
MRLVHRCTVKTLIQPAIDGMVDRYSPIQTEEYLKQMVKDETAYAIFSHRWLVEGELTFQDLSKLESVNVAGLNLLINRPKRELKLLRGAGILDQATVSTANGNAERDGREVFMKMKEICDCLSDQDHCATDLVKLVKFCEAALQCQCDYVWLDTGCINKQSSAELEESVRSMFTWYRNSKICIVHLSQTSVPYTMAQDPWFTRGWTLQELLAPKVIKFFSQSWRPLTVKPNDKIPDAELGIPLWKFISEITRIPEDQLLNFEPGTINVRERMVWVSERKTTRIEDMAYCLIGIFNIPLSIAYGEGQMAFHRLQVEILQRSHDRGLFAWNGSPSLHNTMFAAGPEAFFPLEGSLLTAGEEVAGSADPTYMLTNYGLRIPLSIYDVQRIKALDEHDGAQIMYKLEVLGLGKIKVALEFLREDANLTIGILGNTPGNISLAIVLISPEIGSQQRYKRLTTDVIKLSSSNEWKASKLIFIE